MPSSQPDPVPHVDDGGPAFPFEAPQEIFGGMSLRDYFAAKAMQALITKYGNEDAKTCADYAYTFAVAMLNARGGR